MLPTTVRIAKKPESKPIKNANPKKKLMLLTTAMIAKNQTLKPEYYLTENFSI